MRRRHAAGDERQRKAVAALAENARRNGVEASLGDDGALAVPGESVTDPVAFTLGLAEAARRHGAESCARVSGSPPSDVATPASPWAAKPARPSAAPLALNCAGLGAGEVARSAGDDTFDVYPRKGEFLVFDPPAGGALERVLLPVPEKGTKGVLVFPTLDGKVAAGPTAHDQEDRGDWSVRPEAAREILPKAAARPARA